MGSERPVGTEIESAADVAGRAAENEAIISVVRDYFEQFAHDPAAASLFYGVPATMVLADRLVVFDERKSIQSLLDKTLASLKRRGYSHMQMDGSRTKLLNSTTALHGVVAVRLKADGTVIERLGVTYVLRKDKDRWMIYGWIATDADKLISPN